MSEEFLVHAKIIGAITVDNTVVPVYAGTGSGTVFAPDTNGEMFELDLKGLVTTKQMYDEKLVNSVESNPYVLGIIMGDENQALVQIDKTTFELRKEKDGGYNTPALETFTIELDVSLDIEEFVYEEETSII